MSKQRLIDANALLSDQTNIAEFEYDECCKDEFVSVDAIRGAPTVNAIPTPVRCRECIKPLTECPFKEYVMLKTDYCSHGVKMEVEDDG